MSPYLVDDVVEMDFDGTRVDIGVGLRRVDEASKTFVAHLLCFESKHEEEGIDDV